MTTTLLLDADAFEPVYGWLEQHGDVQVEAWGLENGRRAALLAYSEGPPDGFSWSNWVSAAYQDPSQILALFGQLELAFASEADATTVGGAFPGVFTTTAPS